MTWLYILLITIFGIIVSNVLYTYLSKLVYKSNFFLKNKNLGQTKKLSRENFEWIIWSSISVIFLIYFITVRFYDDWDRFTKYINDKSNYPSTNQYAHSIYISKALLLDMCPFMSLSLPISFICDKTKRAPSFFAPFCIYGGCITLPFIPYSEPNAVFDWHYIFIGTDANPIFFFMHFYLTVFGILALRANTRPKFFDLTYMHIIAAIYFAYVVGVSRTMNVTYNVTGTSMNDWTDPVLGSYHGVQEFLKLDYPAVMIVGFSFSYLVIVGMYLSKIFIHKWVNKNRNNKVVKLLFLFE